MSFDFCYLDNESKINIKNQHVQYDFKDMLMMLQESEHGGDFTIGRVPTATVFDLQPWVLASLVCSLSRFACIGHLHDKGGRQLLALGVCATRVGAKGYRTVAAALLVC